eukprot:1771998-Amphidinium_carterae.1
MHQLRQVAGTTQTVTNWDATQMFSTLLESRDRTKFHDRTFRPASAQMTLRNDTNFCREQTGHVQDFMQYTTPLPLATCSLSRGELYGLNWATGANYARARCVRAVMRKRFEVFRSRCKIFICIASTQC